MSLAPWVEETLDDLAPLFGRPRQDRQKTRQEVQQVPKLDVLSDILEGVRPVFRRPTDTAQVQVRTTQRRPIAREEIPLLVLRKAEEHGVPPSIALAVARVESGFNPNARSPAGAVGVMQLMPGTAKALGVSDPYDPEQNIDAGVRYLKQLYDRYGRWDLALAAYNAGPGNVEKHGGVPPFRETQNYVRNVLRLASRGVQAVRTAVSSAVSAAVPAAVQEFTLGTVRLPTPTGGVSTALGAVAGAALGMSPWISLLSRSPLMTGLSGATAAAAVGLQHGLLRGTAQALTGQGRPEVVIPEQALVEAAAGGAGYGVLAGVGRAIGQAARALGKPVREVGELVLRRARHIRQTTGTGPQQAVERAADDVVRSAVETGRPVLREPAPVQVPEEELPRVQNLTRRAGELADKIRRADLEPDPKVRRARVGGLMRHYRDVARELEHITDRPVPDPRQRLDLPALPPPREPQNAVLEEAVRRAKDPNAARAAVRRTNTTATAPATGPELAEALKDVPPAQATRLAGGFFDSLRSLWETQIASISGTVGRFRAGREIVQRMTMSNYERHRMLGEWFSVYREVARLSPEKKNLVRAVREGRATTDDSQILELVERASKALDEAGQLAKQRQVMIYDPELGLVPFEMRKNFWPVVWDWRALDKPDRLKWVEDRIVENLVKRGADPDEARKRVNRELYTLIRRGGVLFGHLERRREFPIPPDELRLPADVELLVYFKEAASLLSTAKYFGPHSPAVPGEGYGRLGVRVWHGFEDLVEQLRREAEPQVGRERTAAIIAVLQDKFARFTGDLGSIPNPLREMLTNFTVMARMAFSAILNLTQQANIPVRTGVLDYAKGLVDIVRKYRLSREEAMKFGVLVDDVVREVVFDALSSSGRAPLSKASRRFLTVNGFMPVEGWNRLVAFSAGKRWAQSLADRIARNPQDEFARRHLQKLMLDPDKIAARGGVLTDEELGQAGWMIVRDTQFMPTPADFPPFYDSEWGKLVLLFTRFAYMQSRFLYNHIVGEAKEGNLVPLLYVLSTFPVAGDIASYALDRLRGGQRPLYFGELFNWLVSGRKPNVTERELLRGIIGSFVATGQLGITVDVLKNLTEDYPVAPFRPFAGAALDIPVQTAWDAARWAERWFKQKVLGVETDPGVPLKHLARYWISMVPFGRGLTRSPTYIPEWLSRVLVGHPHAGADVFRALWGDREACERARKAYVEAIHRGNTGRASQLASVIQHMGCSLPTYSDVVEGIQRLEEGR